MTNILSRGCVSIVFLSVISAVLLCSCQSRDYYVERAVNDGREYALDHLKNLSPLQRNYIRYNKPVLMDEEYMTFQYSGGFTQADNNSFSQMCMVWNIPGEKLPVIVFGISEHGIRGWSPNRIIRRQFVTKDYYKESAIRNAALYVVNNMLFLPEEDINRVRFSPPEVYYTNFPLNFSAKGENIKMLSEKLKSQIAIVWPAGKSGSKIVIAGIGMEDFAQWVPVTGLLEKEEELKAHIVKTVK